MVMNHGATYRGHLHSGIVPWHRNKGYGTIMLKLALRKCLEKGMEKVQITTCKDNIGAQKTIVKNGGVLLEEFCDDGVEKLRYEIDACL